MRLYGSAAERVTVMSALCQKRTYAVQQKFSYSITSAALTRWRQQSGELAG
jgi:hypothetical protein